MKIVLDANVIVAAFASRGLCESILEVCLHSHEIILSESLLEEVRRNLRKKLSVPQRMVAEIVALLRENAAIVRPVPLPSNVCRDPNDVHVLGAAAAGKARYIVTGDRDLLVLKTFRSIRIVRPRSFSNVLHADDKP